MKIETVIEFLDELYWLRLELLALPNKKKAIKMRREEIAITYKIERMVIARFETELRDELATEMNMLRTLSLGERVTYLFDGPRSVAAIMLVQHLHKHQN